MGNKNNIEIDNLPLVFTGRIQDLLTPSQCPGVFGEIMAQQEAWDYSQAIEARKKASKLAGRSALKDEIQ